MNDPFRDSLMIMSKDQLVDNVQASQKLIGTMTDNKMMYQYIGISAIVGLLLGVAIGHYAWSK